VKNEDLAALLSLDIRQLKAASSNISVSAKALLLIVSINFVLLFVNLYFFIRHDSDYIYDSDFGKYWRYH